MTPKEIGARPAHPTEPTKVTARILELEDVVRKIKQHNARACQIMGILRTETRPIAGHSDPGAVEDCWREAFDELLQQDEVLECYIK